MNDVAFETWRPIPGYEGHYEASTAGRVRSVKPGRPNRVLVATRCGYKKKYLTVELWVNTVHRRFEVHSLVGRTYLGPRPDGQETRHLDGESTNNAVSNLTYGTRSENAADRRRHGTDHNVNKTRCPSGHRYDVANTYVHVRASVVRRMCRACNRAAQARYKARLAERSHVMAGES